MSNDWFVVKSGMGNLLYAGPDWESAKKAYAKSKFGRNIVNNKSLHEPNDLTAEQKLELENL